MRRGRGWPGHILWGALEKGGAGLQAVRAGHRWRVLVKKLGVVETRNRLGGRRWGSILGPLAGVQMGMALTSLGVASTFLSRVGLPHL